MEKQKSLFLQAYGDSPKLRVMDFLITFQDYDYSMKEIAKNSGIGYTTLKEFWPDLVRRKIVKQTRAVGKAKMFKLNLENPEVQLFIKLYWTVIENQTDKLLKPIETVLKTK
ncbi:hypothetical protein COS75_01105 [Candidatus Pacearchaeota archaeon CG06_land_8_20_14_3_00_35_12]|nr:MAG: hypothetical protein COS75_01105 [Candidatus Pacearchaeota archaeon CG06_land_8_20_14_3_00_35_12]